MVALPFGAICLLSSEAIWALLAKAGPIAPEVATVEATLFVAVTTTRIRLPTSAAATV